MASPVGERISEDIEQVLSSLPVGKYVKVDLRNGKSVTGSVVSYQDPDLQVQVRRKMSGGKREGYIYGYIFLSGNKGLVLDEGSNEYPIELAELLINGEFVLMENLTVDLLRRKNLYGSKARIKESFIS